MNCCFAFTFISPVTKVNASELLQKRDLIPSDSNLIELFWLYLSFAVWLYMPFSVAKF